MQNRFKLKLSNIFPSPSGSYRIRNLSDEIEKAALEIRQVDSALVRRITEQIQLMEETVKEFTDSAPRLTRTPSQTYHFLPLCFQIPRPGYQAGPGKYAWPFPGV
ncbi:hypothetical protein ACFX13_032824 [Malus domestica]